MPRWSYCWVSSKVRNWSHWGSLGDIIVIEVRKTLEENMGAEWHGQYIQWEPAICELQQQPRKPLLPVRYSGQGRRVQQERGAEKSPLHVRYLVKLHEWCHHGRCKEHFIFNLLHMCLYQIQEHPREEAVCGGSRQGLLNQTCRLHSASTLWDRKQALPLFYSSVSLSVRWA